jgi:hypothetical protein
MFFAEFIDAAWVVGYESRMVSESPCPSFTASPCSRGGRQIALLTGLLFSTTLSFSDPLPTVVEGMSPTYRKVTLSGRPLASSMPQHLPDSDSEPEQTFIDPLTLTERNSLFQGLLIGASVLPGLRGCRASGFGT